LENEFRTNDESYLKQGINTNNKQFNEMISLIEKVAVRNNRPFLIDGATGAGKTQLAKLIYALKKKKGIIEGEFKYLNCATLRAEQAQSILFGHKKGSFTGAITNRDGALIQANKGMLFLDEIGTLPSDVQGMLLHAIEAKEFYPMGSDTLAKSDFTLVCGTNIDLEEAVLNGDFRDDLLARINLWHFTLPSLHERKEDIEPNINYELRRYCKENKTKVRFNKESRNQFLKFSISDQALWKRNFRDLSASIERMSTLCDRGIINEAIVASEIKRLEKSWSNSKAKTNDELVEKLYLVLAKEIYQDLDMLEVAQLKVFIGASVNAKSAAEAARRVYTNQNGECPVNPGSMFAKTLKRFRLHFDDINKAHQTLL